MLFHVRCRVAIARPSYCRRRDRDLRKAEMEARSPYPSTKPDVKMPANAASAAPPITGLSTSRADSADGNEDRHRNDNDSPCHWRVSQICVGCLNRTASNMFRCIYGKSRPLFFEGPRLQIAMMWAVKRRSNSAFAAKEPNDQPSNSFAQNTRTLWE
jgi:hypothetical protein